MGNDAAIAVSVENVRKSFTTKTGPVLALEDASFTASKEEFVSLVGPSGCGKSTLLKILAGLVTGYSGDVSVWGASPKPGRVDTGIMLQRAVLLPWRSVIDNVLLPCEVGGRSKHGMRDRALELLEMVGLGGFADNSTWELSGGMQQRVSLARLLVLEPDLLLMDEPFAALDEFTRERLNAEIARLHEKLKRTVVYVTHNIAEAVFLSDRVVVMQSAPGRVVATETITVPRPRTLASIGSEQTQLHVARIREALELGHEDANQKQANLSMTSAVRNEAAK